MESLGALNFAMRHADQLLAKMDFSIADAIDRTASMHLGKQNDSSVQDSRRQERAQQVMFLADCVYDRLEDMQLQKTISLSELPLPVKIGAVYQCIGCKPQAPPAGSGYKHGRPEKLFDILNRNEWKSTFHPILDQIHSGKFSQHLLNDHSKLKEQWLHHHMMGQLPGGSVLLPNPNPMMPGTDYQYQPGLMGQYIPNMSTQVIQTPMPYMQPPAYRSPAPVVPQQPLQKSERKPIPIVDPNTKTVIVQVSTPH
eukprot:Em0008g1163a